MLAVGDEWRPSDPQDRLANVCIEIREGLDGERGCHTGLSLQLRAKPVVGDALHPAVGVMDQHDVRGAQSPLGDGKGAHHVVSDDAPSIPEDMRLSGLQTKRREDIQARVHTGDDGQVERRLDACAFPPVINAEGGIVREKLVNEVHVGQP